MLCENPQVQDAIGRADAILNAGRAYRSAMIAELWDDPRRRPGDHARATGALPARRRSTPATARARRWTWCTGTAAAPRSSAQSRLAECWRDLHTVGQTVTLAPEWYPIGGRAYLGLDPGPRLR